jgi:hypothetical protein
MTNYISIGGKERPIRFSYKALKAISTKLKIKLTEFDKILDQVDNIGVLTFYGLQSGAISEGLEVDFNKAKVEDWLDDAGFGIIGEVIQAFGDSQVLNDDKPKAEEVLGNV